MGKGKLKGIQFHFWLIISAKLIHGSALKPLNKKREYIYDYKIY